MRPTSKKATIVNFDFGSNQPMMGEPLKTIVIDGCHSPKCKPQWTLCICLYTCTCTCSVMLCHHKSRRWWARIFTFGEKIRFSIDATTFPHFVPFQLQRFNLKLNDTAPQFMKWSLHVSQTGCNLTNQSTKSSSSARRSSLAPPPPGESSDDGHWLLIACQSPPSQIMECHLGTQIIWFLWKVSKFGKTSSILEFFLSG